MENLHHHHHHTTPPNSPREQGDSWQQKTFTPTFESGVWVYGCVYITATAIGLQPNPYLFQCFLFFAVYEETIAKPRQWVSLHLRAITTSRERVCVCVCVCFPCPFYDTEQSVTSRVFVDGCYFIL
jgi:hypothetical protein